jgi:putative RNA 2'-phosphotransferase
MSNSKDTRISKWLSLVLRHKPEEANLTLDENGWTSTVELVKAMSLKYPGTTKEDFVRIVTECPKQRYAFNDIGTKVRANQGHSVDIDLKLEPSVPLNPILYHGTATRFMDSIRAKGLIPGSRKQVHLSYDHDTAVNVGSRHGTPVILEIDAAQMIKDGYLFYRADNGVWLTDSVPWKYVLRMTYV